MKNKFYIFILINCLSITVLNASAKDKVKEMSEQNKKINEQMVWQIDKTGKLIKLYNEELVFWEKSIFNNELINQMRVLNESK